MFWGRVFGTRGAKGRLTCVLTVTDTPTSAGGATTVVTDALVDSPPNRSRNEVCVQNVQTFPKTTSVEHIVCKGPSISIHHA